MKQQGPRPESDYERFSRELDEKLDEMDRRAEMDPCPIMRLEAGPMGLILESLMPREVIAVMATCKELREAIRGRPAARALAHFYRSRTDIVEVRDDGEEGAFFFGFGRFEERQTPLMHAVARASSLPNIALSVQVMEELVRGIHLTESDGRCMMRNGIGAYCDESIARALSVLARLPGFREHFLTARDDFYASPLHCACINVKPRTAELLLRYPETDLNVIVGNGIVAAPLLHFLAVRWDADEMERDAGKARILRALLERPDLDIHRSWHIVPLGPRKVLELVYREALPTEQDDLHARQLLLLHADICAAKKPTPVLAA